MSKKGDATTLTLKSLGDPSQYQLMRSVPIFRAHTRQFVNDDGTTEEREVTEADLLVIAEHMSALEADGMVFRLTNGHCNPFGDENEQPELLGYQTKARLSTFGPENVPCVMVDEYGKKEKISVLKNRPYRSAEFYRHDLVIKGCAALIRDPKLNLGAVTYYGASQKPWYYSEALNVNETELTAAIKAILANELPAAIKAATLPAPRQPEPNRNDDKPELYAELARRAETSEKAAKDLATEVSTLRAERNRERLEVEVKELATHYRLDVEYEVGLMLPMVPEARIKHVEHLKKTAYEINDMPIPVAYNDRPSDLPASAEERKWKPASHDKAMEIMRANPGLSYQDAELKARGIK